VGNTSAYGEAGSGRVEEGIRGAKGANNTPLRFMGIYKRKVRH